MIRRLAISTAAFAMSLLVLPANALAHGDRPSACIKAARQARRSCFLGCGDTFQSEFVACFGGSGGNNGGGSGGGTSCAAACLTARLTCEAGPTQAIHTCVGDIGNAQSCRFILKSTLLTCRTNANPEACMDQARLDALKCRQSCIDAQAPAIQACRNAFHACLVPCPSSPAGAFLDGE
jgi:hypothetical protein